jgi:hypothetical protein
LLQGNKNISKQQEHVALQAPETLMENSSNS